MYFYLEKILSYASIPKVFWKYLSIFKKVKALNIIKRIHMKKTTFGFSLLEFVITLPITMLFLFGVTDIMRVMSSQTALDSGTESALRCLSPIKGDCNTNVTDNYKKMFDVYSSNKTNSYLIDQYKFSATANTLKTDQFETTASANILKTGTVKFQTFQTSYRELSYKADVEAKFLIMTQSLPQILGDNFKLEDQTFTLKKNKNKKYLPTVENSSEFSLIIKKEEQEANETKEITFFIPKMENCDPSLPCFLSSDIDKDNLISKQANFNKTCSQAFSWKNEDTFGVNENYSYKELKNSKMACETTPVVIFIKGNSSISENDIAQVDIEIINENGKAIRDLGGRVFDKNSSASLVARGAEKENYSDVLKESFGDKEILYHQAIQLDFNKKYKIRFKLKRLNDSFSDNVTWVFKNLKIFTPQYKSESIKKACKNTILLSTPKTESINECDPIDVPLKAREILHFTLNTYGEGIPSNKYIYSNCNIENESKEGVMKKNHIDVSLVNSFMESKPKSCNNFSTLTYDCPKNFGTKEKKEYENICPPDSLINNYAWNKFYSPTINSSNFTLENIHLGNVIWNKKNCNDTQEYIKDDWKRYNDLSLNTKKIGTISIDLSHDKFCENLNDIKKEYSCKDFFFKTSHITPETTEQLQTMLTGKYEGIKCSWENDNWKNILYEDILQNWTFTKDSCFDMKMTHAGLKTSNALPSDSCSSYYIASNESSEDKKFLGNFEENSFPTECKEKYNCKYVFTGFKGNPSIPNHNAEKNLENAKIVASNNIQKLIPQSKENCSGIYCLKLEAKETENKVFFNSTIDVPLYTLLGKTVKISSGSSKEKEQF